VVKYCDLIMKGGITSGVIYPKAVSKPSKTFHFRNIGGASAGAIAAAGAAAAEYGRLNGKIDSFDKLEKLPADLGADTGFGHEKLLAGLLQAGPQTAGLEKTMKDIEAAAQADIGKFRKSLRFAAAPVSRDRHDFGTWRCGLTESEELLDIDELPSLVVNVEIPFLR
jgi:hypothetical protein